MDMQLALDTVHGNVAQTDDEQYLAACKYLVQHRAELPYRIFVCLPGGLTGNNNPDWDEIKAGSTERCSCGNERVITPSHPREDFQPSESGTVVVAVDSPVFLRPLGGGDASAYIRLKIEGANLAFVEDPLASFVARLDMLKAKGFGLQTLADALPAQPKPPVFLKAGRIPIFSIDAVNVVAQTVTITPDVAVEAFTPGQEAGAQHAC